MVSIRFDPGECRDALARTSGPVVVDIETTGLSRHSLIVSIGVLVDQIAYVLFVRSLHVSIRNLPWPIVADALAPLTRRDLVVVGHNFGFDLGFLQRAGVEIGGEIRDTLAVLRLLDQDRLGGGAGRGKRFPRRDLQAPDYAPGSLDYRLKHVAGQLLRLRMVEFPGNVQLRPLALHARYLVSDLKGTRALYDHLWPQLGLHQMQYYRRFVGPLIPLLVEMSARGIRANAGFITSNSVRLETLLADLSSEHRRSFGVALGMDRAELEHWLFARLKLPSLKRSRRGQNWVNSLDDEALERLDRYNQNASTRRSLELIRTYREAASLLVRLRTLSRHITPRDGRIHSSLADTQATGRISATTPNLQAIAKARKIDGIEIRSRDVLVATPGYELAVFDIAQADVRVLAATVENFAHSSDDHRRQLRNERNSRLGSKLAPYLSFLQSCRNPAFVSQSTQSLEFDPAMPRSLANAFRQPGDFYSEVINRMLGRPPTDRAERNRLKPVVLAVINGKGAPSLARDLKCTEVEARQHLAAFDKAFPDVAAFKELMYYQIAFTGQTSTILGRVRTVTAHAWMVNEPVVEFLVTYRRSDRYWVEAVPLVPSRRVLTTYVLRVWDARRNRLIYDYQRGRLSSRSYRVFEDLGLLYQLPVRNWAWRSIRRVRAHGQEARYDGFDATARSAFNFICQAGTADLVKLMMFRSQHLNRIFEARLLLQIHDELVFEVPTANANRFIAEMRDALERPPNHYFRVPIVVEAKRGQRFGDLAEVDSPRPFVLRLRKMQRVTCRRARRLRYRLRPR